MSHIRFWLHPMQNHICYQQIAQPFPGDIRSIRFLEAGSSPISHAVYLGTETDFCRILREKEERWGGATVFLADAGDRIPPGPFPSGFNLIGTSLDLFSLYRILSDTLLLYQEWNQTFLLACGKGASLSDLAAAVKRLTGASVSFLDEHFFPSGSFDFEFLPGESGSLPTAGSLPPDFRDFLEKMNQKNGESLPPRYLKFHYRNHCCLLYRTQKKPGCAAYLLLWTPNEDMDFDARTLLHLLCRALARLENKEIPDPGPRNGLYLLLHEILEKGLRDPDAIARLFSSLECPPERFYRILLVEFVNPARAFLEAPVLLDELGALFPGHSRTIFQNQIVLIQSRPDRFPPEDPLPEQNRLQELLKKWDALALIGTPTSRRGQMRTALLLTRKALSLMKKLRRGEENRSFFFDDCAEYLTIDLCCRSYTALVGHEDLIYLTQPELIGVYRHDKKEKDDLLDVLYHYCLNNCNISQTARAVYMHRNTVAAKVEKLKALVHADLTDGNIQQRMVFSYRVLRYAEVFSGRKPEELLLENSVDG